MATRVFVEGPKRKLLSLWPMEFTVEDDVTTIGVNCRRTYAAVPPRHGLLLVQQMQASNESVHLPAPPQAILFMWAILKRRCEILQPEY